jgi:hypothetical protein
LAIRPITASKKAGIWSSRKAPKPFTSANSMAFIARDAKFPASGWDARGGGGRRTGMISCRRRPFAQ